jgi:pSer/pThr/pTyr-binding forkhead associated (FHA) protein
VLQLGRRGWTALFWLCAAIWLVPADRGVAQTREDSAGIYQIITVGHFSPEDEARIRQLEASARQQSAAAQPGGTQPGGTTPRTGPPLPPGEVGPRARPPQQGQQATTPENRPILSAASGTGFLVRGPRTLVTNNHVSNAPPRVIGNTTFQPQRASHFVAYLRGGVAQLTPLRLLARTAEKDIALFEAEQDLPGRTFTLAEYDPSFDVEVEAVGFPGIADITSAESDVRVIDASLGVPVRLSMSQLHPIKTQGRVQRLVDAALQVEGANLRARTILHTATISSGNSGGPLINRCGQVVGINTFVNTAQRGGGQALFSVHTRELAEFMRANSVQPVVAASFCFFPGSPTEYVPHLGAFAALLLGLAAVAIARSKPQLVQQTAQRVSRVFSRPAPKSAHAPAGSGANRDVALSAARPAVATRGPSTRPWQKTPEKDTISENTGNLPTTLESATLGIPAPREARLVSMQGREAIPLKPDQMTEGRSVIIGRDRSSDAVVEETSVSRRHARLVLDGAGQLLVTDLGSVNGTWRENQSISSATFAPGEEIRFGTQRYRFELEPAPPAEPRGPSWVLAARGEKGELVQVRLVPKADRTTGAALETEWVIGRNEKVADIAVKASEVSSSHALLRFRPGSGLEIADRGSSNGTYLDGERIGTSFVRIEGDRTVLLGEVELSIKQA